MLDGCGPACTLASPSPVRASTCEEDSQRGDVVKDSVDGGALDKLSEGDSGLESEDKPESAQDDRLNE